MKKRTVVAILFCSVIGAMIFSSCRHGCGEPAKASSYNSDRSHNMGLNCFNCHSGTGQGKGCFAVAGTVYSDSLGTQIRSNATIKLYSQPDGAGQLLKKIEGDEKGNFYDGSDDGLVGSYFPVVVSSNGSIKKMLEPISKGDCNRCHGVSTNKIWVN